MSVLIFIGCIIAICIIGLFVAIDNAVEDKRKPSTLDEVNRRRGYE